MFAHFGYQSLALSILFGNTIALDLNTNSQDSINSVAKTLASGVVSRYNRSLEDEGVPGLFGDPYYWWEAGAVFGGLIEYAHLTGDDQYNELIGMAMGHQMGEYNFMPMNQSKNLGNDDQSFWALAAMTAAETGLTAPNDVGNWLDLAVNVFNLQILRWNTDSCDGGLKWQIYAFNAGFNYKNSISTGNLFLLSARLAQFTGNATYSEWAEKALKWTQDVGLVSENYAVFDGTKDDSNCSTINRIQWSMYSATFAEGAALMYNLTNGDAKWKTAVAGFVNSSSVFHTDDSVLFEVACEEIETCNVDQRAFKGIAIRSWARAAQAAPFASNDIMKVVKASASAAAKACEIDDDDVKCTLKWTNATSDTPSTGFGEVHNALQAVLALQWPQAKALATNNTSPGTPPAGDSTGNGSETTPGAPQNTDAPGAASTLAASSAVLCTAIIVAILCL